ncbi:hypothetical protein ANCCAN_22884 [Ancylostoma caninum]|uniref:Uncharacterized protein n=1 Tax=Ancylostoma caninum TaxID=29170 RepID=A0A368FGK2_ANCCA|nr:hypothetical protein ANCCAN_22884 [Ancylostoma caninum]
MAFCKKEVQLLRHVNRQICQGCLQLLQLATRLSYCKANYLFVNFEVRTTDRYQLPYTNRDLFHMMQVCEELFVTLVPSFDTQSNYIEPGAARDIIEYFLNDFPLSKTAHFGPNLTSILIANRNGESLHKPLKIIPTSIFL